MLQEMRQTDSRGCLRYFPNCRYGDSCAFSHNPEAFNVSAADGSVNGQAFSPTHASPGPDPGMGFFNPYAAPPQPGMPPMDYYGAPMGPGFYGPPPPAGAYPGYGPVPYYGYGGGYYPSPPESTSPALPGQQSAATSTVEGTASQEPGVPPSANGVASPCTSVSAESPVFVPQSSSVQEFSSQALTSPVPSAPTALAVGQVPAATQPNGPPKHFDGHRALRNSHAFNSSTNRRERGPTASSARTSIKGNAAKKPHQVACTFFHNNSCRLGDACQFSHILSDGSDAKLQASNIVGVDGRVGDVATLEEFKRTECLRKERLAATGGISHRPRGDGLPHSRPTAHHAGGHSRFTAPMQHSSGLPGVDHHYYSAPRKNFMNGAPRGRAAHNAPRLPSGEDFPALPAGQVSPRNESPSAKPATPSNIVLMEDVATPVSTDAELGSGVPSGASTPVTPASTHEAAAAAVSAIPKLVSSFASAAARGASAPPPPSRPHQQRGHGRNSKSAAPAPAPADAAPTPAEAAPSADPVAA